MHNDEHLSEQDRAVLARIDAKMRAMVADLLHPSDDSDGGGESGTPAPAAEAVGHPANAQLPTELQAALGGLVFAELNPTARAQFWGRYQRGELKPAPKPSPMDLSGPEFQSKSPEFRLCAARRNEEATGQTAASRGVADRRLAELRAAQLPEWANASAVRRLQLSGQQLRQVRAEREVGLLTAQLPNLNGSLRNNTESRIAAIKRSAGL